MLTIDLLDVYVELGPNIAMTPSDASAQAIFNCIRFIFSVDF